MPLCAIWSFDDRFCFMKYSGEALQDGSPENAELRDQLAELWLKTVKEAKRVGLPMLQMRAWLLLPGSELAQQRALSEADQ